jgi:elongation factor G
MNTTTRKRLVPMERTRNVGIAAHIDAGKTTLTERILFYAGVVHQPGEVHEGTTRTDFDPIERLKGITIGAAAISCAWPPPPSEGGPASPLAPHRINIIDTPGHVDFTAEVERSMRVLDGAIAVFSAVEGVQPQSETVWRQATRYGVPRVAFINKMDRLGANFERVVAEMRTKLRANAWPVLIPIGREGELRGQIDVIQNRAIVYDPTDKYGLRYRLEDLDGPAQAVAAEARRGLIAALAEIDPAIADKFLAEAPIHKPELSAAIRRQTIANRFVPVVGGSAFKFVGVQALMDAVVDFLPSPGDLPPATGTDPETGDSVEVPARDDAPLRALIFKSSTDAAARRRIFVRVYSGVLRPGDTVLNTVTSRRERVSRVLEIQADKEIAMEAAFAGDIAVVAGLKEVVTGHTLCAEDAPVLLEPPTFPEPVVSMAIEPETRVDQERMGFVLQRLAEDDPTFRVSTDPETGQTLIAGMGELHLEVLRQRMLGTFKVATRAGAPEIAYRETITAAASGEGRVMKQSGGPGQYAIVNVEVTPRARGSGLVVTDQVTGGAIPRQFIGAVKKGILEAARNGLLGGYPVVDLEVDIVDGKFHAKDSNDLAFQTAGSLAFKDAVAKTRPVLLEPMMKVECTTPAEFQGDLVGDLHRRRGTVREVAARPESVTITGEAPLAAMFGYANAIRSLSKGRAEYSMELSHFAVVPPELAAKALSKR